MTEKRRRSSFIRYALPVRVAGGTKSSKEEQSDKSNPSGIVSTANGEGVTTMASGEETPTADGEGVTTPPAAGEEKTDPLGQGVTTTIAGEETPTASG